MNENTNTELEKTPAYEGKQQKVVAEITALKTEEEVWVEKRKGPTYKIPIGEMDEIVFAFCPLILFPKKLIWDMVE